MRQLLTCAGLLFISFSIPALTTQQTAKSSEMEKEKIIQAITNVFTGSDERDWQKVEASMAEKVLLDYTSMAGGKPVSLTREQITGSWKTILPGFQSTHHQIGNFAISIEGNKAKANFHGLALHYLPNERKSDYWVVTGTYEYELSKNKRGDWVADKIRFNLQKQQGNLELPSLAQSKVKEGATFNIATLSAEAERVVEDFFTSLEKLDVGSFMKVWADNGIQLMPLAPEGFPKELTGKEAIYNQYKALPENYSSMKFPRRMFPTEDPNKVIVQYAGLIPLKAGGAYNNNYVGVFEIKEGKLRKFTEYFDPFILEEAFGKKLQSNFNVNTNK